MTDHDGLIDAWITQAAEWDMQNPYINISLRLAGDLGIAHLADPIGAVSAPGFVDISIERLREWRLSHA